MRWFRTNRFAAWLALFALTLQFVLSFSHVHLVGGSYAKAAAQAQLAAKKPSPTAPALPAPPSHRPGDPCAICNVLHMAAAAVPAAEPSLPSPPNLSSASLRNRIDVGIAASVPLSFQARAPPQA